MLENMGLTPVARSYRQYSRHYCKLVFKQDNLRLIPVQENENAGVKHKN